ncbi:MAG TPA: hypothetical protein VJC07_04000 [Candidatus Nanoarchaeia archaeon]|nr:hypothetical protein [Candidatus Nanoarchaeia archaeon]
MITITLGAITALFIAYALSKSLIEKIFNLKICSLCAAVMTTWIGMLVMKFIGVAIDNTVLGILMGESIAGIMYRLSGKPKINPFVGLPTILAGTTLAYLIIAGIFEPVSLLIIIPVMIMMLFMGMAGKKPDAKGKALLKKLENCCG